MSAEPVTVRRVGLGLALVAALLTSACAAGQHAQTADQKATLDGTNISVGKIDLRALAIDSPGGTNYTRGSDAPVKLVLVNTGSTGDTLTSISSPAVTGWAAYASAAQVDTAISAQQAGTKATPRPLGSVAIPAGGRVSYGTPDAVGGLLLTGAKQAIYPGTTITLTFTFANAGSITAAVPIQLSADPGTSVVPSPSTSDDAG